MILLRLYYSLAFEEERVRSFDNIILHLASDFNSIEQLFALHMAMFLQICREVLYTIAFHLGAVLIT
jgi:hypothetical protein